MIVSAHEICRTRLCRAANCEHEAEPYSRFCWLCQRRPRVTEHPAPGPLDGPTLRCSNCGAFKPDTEFSVQRDKPRDRRGRHSECRACAALRRMAERNRYRERVGIVPCCATNGSYRHGRHGEPCRLWSLPGSFYCSNHTRQMERS